MDQFHLDDSTNNLDQFHHPVNNKITTSADEKVFKHHKRDQKKSLYLQDDSSIIPVERICSILESSMVYNTKYGAYEASDQLCDPPAVRA